MIIRFSDIEINSETFNLRKGGEQVNVEPLIFDLLLHLVSSPSKVHSRDDLMHAVWSGRVVSDSSISSAIKSVRKVLGDSGQAQRYIKTIHGRGFQFVGELCESETVNITTSSISETISPTKPLSILLLPSQVLDKGNTNFNFSDELVAGLEVMLSRVPLLQISAQSADYRNLNPKPSPRQIFEETGVVYILECSVQNVEGLVRVNVQLTDAKAGFRVWSERFKQFNVSHHELIDNLVIDIIAKLEPELNKAIYESVRAIDGEPTARELYLQASTMLSVKGWHADTFLKAEELLNKSEALDSSYALTPAYLALILALGHRVGLLTEKNNTKAKVVAAAERALKLDNIDTTVLGYVGCALADVGMLTRAKPLLKNAVKRNDHNAQAWAALGSANLFLGNAKEAIECLSHGIRISPLDSRLAIWGSILAIAYMFCSEFDLAKQQAELACERDDQGYIPRVVLAAIELILSNTDIANEVLLDAYRIKPDLSDHEICSLIGHKFTKKLLALDKQ